MCNIATAMEGAVRKVSKVRKRRKGPGQYNTLLGNDWLPHLLSAHVRLATASSSITFMAQ
jgi:hypothetical protein